MPGTAFRLTGRPQAITRWSYGSCSGPAVERFELDHALREIDVRDALRPAVDLREKLPQRRGDRVGIDRRPRHFRQQGVEDHVILAIEENDVPCRLRQAGAQAPGALDPAESSADDDDSAWLHDEGPRMTGWCPASRESGRIGTPISRAHMTTAVDEDADARRRDHWLRGPRRRPGPADDSRRRPCGWERLAPADVDEGCRCRRATGPLTGSTIAASGGAPAATNLFDDCAHGRGCAGRRRRGRRRAVSPRRALDGRPESRSTSAVTARLAGRQPGALCARSATVRMVRQTAARAISSRMRRDRALTHRHARGTRRRGRCWPRSDRCAPPSGLATTRSASGLASELAALSATILPRSASRAS